MKDFAPVLDKLRDEIANAAHHAWFQTAYGPNSMEVANIMVATLTRHIPADVLAGLLDGTMVAVPRRHLTADEAKLFTQALIEQSTPEPRTPEPPDLPTRWSRAVIEGSRK